MMDSPAHYEQEAEAHFAAGRYRAAAQAWNFAAAASRGAKRIDRYRERADEAIDLAQRAERGDTV